MNGRNFINQFRNIRNKKGGSPYSLKYLYFAVTNKGNSSFLLSFPSCGLRWVTSILKDIAASEFGFGGDDILTPLDSRSSDRYNNLSRSVGIDWLGAGHHTPSSKTVYGIQSGNIVLLRRNIFAVVYSQYIKKGKGETLVSFVDNSKIVDRYVSYYSAWFDFIKEHKASCLAINFEDMKERPYVFVDIAEHLFRSKISTDIVMGALKRNEISKLAPSPLRHKSKISYHEELGEEDTKYIGTKYATAGGENLVRLTV